MDRSALHDVFDKPLAAIVTELRKIRGELEKLNARPNPVSLPVLPLPGPTPPVYVPHTFSPGFQCSACGTWVPGNTSHMCVTY
jgi:hypothetical protein